MENVNHTARTRGRYVGPTAARIAELIATRQRVRFEQGWFWTAAVCHDSEQEQLSFRQRPDGDGIDIRCPRVGARGRQAASCSRERMIRSLEQVTGESIWSAYATEPRTSASAQSPAAQDDRTGGRPRRLAIAPVVVLLLAAPLVLGFDLQVAALNAAGIGWAGWLARGFVLSRRHAAAKGGRPR